MEVEVTDPSSISLTKTTHSNDYKVNGFNLNIYQTGYFEGKSQEIDVDVFLTKEQLAKLIKLVESCINAEPQSIQFNL